MGEPYRFQFEDGIVQCFSLRCRMTIQVRVPVCRTLYSNGLRARSIPLRKRNCWIYLLTLTAHECHELWCRLKSGGPQPQRANGTRIGSLVLRHFWTRYKFEGHVQEEYCFECNDQSSYCPTRWRTCSTASASRARRGIESALEGLAFVGSDSPAAL